MATRFGRRPLSDRSGAAVSGYSRRKEPAISGARDGGHKAKPLDPLAAPDVYMIHSIRGGPTKVPMTTSADGCFSSARSKTLALRA